MNFFIKDFKINLFKKWIFILIFSTYTIFFLLLGIFIKNDFDTDKSISSIFSNRSIYIEILITILFAIYTTFYNKFIKEYEREQSEEDKGYIEKIKANAYPQLNDNLIKSIIAGDKKGFDRTIDFINKIKKGLGK